MGIMAGDTAQRSLAFPVAAAFAHLFHLADCLTLLGQLRPAFEDRLEGIKRQAGTIVERPPAVAGNARLALEMALLTNRVTQKRLQAAGVDDSVVQLGRGIAALAALHVERARAVTALA